jgi:hypothetical protein
VPVLRQEMAKENEPRLKLWLTIAAGMSGDETVAQNLHKVIASESEDSSLRAIALRAYGHSLKDKAIPLLEQYIWDITPGPNRRSPPLSTVARSELARLGRLRNCTTEGIRFGNSVYYFLGIQIPSDIWRPVDFSGWLNSQ